MHKLPTETTTHRPVKTPRGRKPKQINPLKMLAVGIGVIIVALFIGFIYALYEKKITLNASPEQVLFSKSTIKQLDSAVNDHDFVVGSQIAKVDLDRNERSLLYTYIKDPVLKSMYESFVASRITISIPIFTKDDANNARMVKIINHEYVCSPYTSTITYKYMPSSTSYIATVCAVSIPPSYGNFKGIVALYLNREPTELEKDQIRILLKDVAEKLYPEFK